MDKPNDKNQEQGLILIELLTAMAVFAISVVTIFALFVNSTKGIMISLEKTRANLSSNEALEAAFSISKSDQDYLTPGKYEAGINNENQWVLIPRTGLMGHFLLSNDTQDSSPYQNQGEAQKITFFEDRNGQSLAAAVFNGTDSYINTELAFSLQIEGPLTLSAWVLDSEQEITPVRRTIASKYDFSEEKGGYMLYKEGNYYYFLISGEESTTSISAQSDNLSWEQVVGVYDPGQNEMGKTTLSLYVNGIKKASDEINITAINKAPGTEFFIGNDAGLSSPWQGRISDVRVYNRALTANEISGLYGSYSVPYEKSLVVSDIDSLTGIWSFNEGEGCTANDNSGNNNHGVIKNCSPAQQWVDNRNENEGRAFNFENDNYIEIADSSTLRVQNEISITLWIKMPEDLPKQDMTILHKRAAAARDYSFALTYQAIEEGYGWAVATSTPSHLTQVALSGSAVPNRWQHLIATFDSTSTTPKIYIDNREIDNDDLEEADFDNSGSNSNLFIGRGADGNNNLSEVIIDDLRIYNKILEPTERQSVFLEKPNYYLE